MEHHRHRGATVRARVHADIAVMDKPSRTDSNGSHHARDLDVRPYNEDVLLSLQLLAYLSKHPHVRQASTSLG